MNNYPYDCGKLLAAICKTHCEDGMAPDRKVTATVLGNIAMRPDLMRTYLRYFDLSGFDFPEIPANWKPGANSESRFWLGYYHQKHRYYQDAA
jgi:hypothetical protein